jgi:peptidoglycan/xylan/chitin deacetylase (PgdA/CDA1 family)
MIRKLVFGFVLITGCLNGIFAQGIKQAIPDKLVVLTFDDAVLSHYTNVAPLLKKYGFTATFYVCEFGGTPNFSDKTKYMSWEQIAQLNKMGFEIGNHTQHHVHVNKLDNAKLIAELEYVEQKCAEYHIPRPVTFAYPGYDTSRRALQVLKDKGYKFARGGWDRVYDPKTDQPLLMPGYTTHTEKADDAYGILKQAKDGKIAVLTIHGVPDDAHPWVTTSPEVFEGYLKYLKENHYHVIAMRDLDKYISTDN